MVEPCAGNALARGEIILEDGMRLDRGQTLSVCALESQRTLCITGEKRMRTNQMKKIFKLVVWGRGRSPPQTPIAVLRL